MLLKEVLEHLSFSEFSQVKLGGSTLGSIESADYPQIVSFINLALTDLYKRFLLSEKEVIIQQFENITDYRIHSDYTITKGTAPFMWVMDSPQNPFKDDLIKVEKVYDELGVELPIDELESPSSVFFTAYDTIQIPYPDNDIAVAVHYRAAPVVLSTTTPDPDTMEIFIPSVLLSALLAFIAARAHKPLASETNRNSSDYLGQYLALCAEIDLYGSVNTARTDNNNKFNNNGWT